MNGAGVSNPVRGEVIADDQGMPDADSHLQHLRDVLSGHGGAARRLPDLRGRAAVRAARRTGLDHAGEASGRPRQRLAAPGSRSVRDPYPSGIWDRPARAAVADPQGNILWDCIALLDDATETLVRALGGLQAIAISHPHYYTCMQDWARAFSCPVHLHAADADWVMRPDPAIHPWSGETLEIMAGVTLLRLGGHFPGGTVLHWADGADRRGALLSGDIVQVAPDLKAVSFLWSYPNMMPLAAATVLRIAATLAPWQFDRIYGAFPGRQITAGGARAVQRSAKRYIELSGDTQP